MTESLIKTFTEKLKCGVCHHTFLNPKDLPCSHSVCNDCLDGLVSFQEDGTGTLQCPHGWDGVIKIGVDDSVSSTLSSNYVTRDLLSCIKETKKIDLSLCQNGGSDCDKMACNSCSVCSKKTCTSCWKDHNCENKTSTSVIFDERKQSFEAICKLHGAHARSICMDCGNHFICIYCSNRAHQTHMTDTVESHAIILKNTFSMDFENTKKGFPNAGISYKDELNNIAEKRMDLVNELEERIVKKLNRYTTSLNEQKDILLQKFDAKVGEYQTQLTEFGLEELNYEEAFLSYIDKLNTKPFFEILSEKDEIMQKAATLGSVHCLIASLTDCDDDKENTIGDLYVTTCKKNEMHEDDKVVDVIYEKSYETDEECTEDLENLIKNITKIFTQDTKQRIRNMKTNKYSFDDIFQLLQNDNINELKLLLRYRPDVINLKNSSKQTLIYKASELGKHESLRLFLDTNIDSVNTCSQTYLPITIASRNGHTLCVEILLKHNCNVNAKDGNGSTALMHASQEGHTSCAELLLKYNCDINSKNNGGYTALMCASSGGKLDCINILLAKNADIDIKSKDSRTAKDLACTTEIQQFLTKYKNNK